MHCALLMLTICLSAVQDFLRNNRGINDGGDLPEDFMSSLYERIQTNEIKMKVCSQKPAEHFVCPSSHTTMSDQ